MCRSSRHKTGPRSCKRTEEQRQKANARKRAKYKEKKGNVENGSNRTGTNGIPEASGMEGRLVSVGEGQHRVSLDGSGHRDGNRLESLSIDGVEVKVLAVHQPTASSTSILLSEGKSSPALYEIAPENAGAFRNKINKLQENNKFHASVYVYEEDEYKDMRLFLTDDGESGIALKSDGDIVSVFSSKKSKYVSPVYSMLSTTIAQGGTKLDCFDTVLPKIYKQQGFVEVGRDSWDEQYKPEGWEYETYGSYNNGRPDIVYMEYREPVEEKLAA